MARASYVDALNAVLLIGSIIAAVAAVGTFFLIRQRDFHDPGAAPAQGPPASEAVAA